jgi:hypothetical protein
VPGFLDVIQFQSLDVAIFVVSIVMVVFQKGKFKAYL